VSTIPPILEEITTLLASLVETPSLSREEEDAASLMRNFLDKKDIPFSHRDHNTWAFNRHYDAGKPTILLNSHIDTVKPAKDWATDPFTADLADGKLTGLGSNDAGAALVCLLGAFLYFYDKEMSYNILFAATAEEEISGKNGIAGIADITSNCAFAIIGEPTGMQMAIAEKGLLVLDAVVTGKAGHAAREEGVNAIYLAMEDILWFREHNFSKVSLTLGPVKSTVTVIHAGEQHNVVPAECRYTVDVRTTPEYTHEELIDLIARHVHADITPRSTRLQPSAIASDHVLAKAAAKLGIPTFGSATLSDQALLNIPSVKIGPGLSERSHTAGEHIYLSELENGLKTYIQLLEEIFALS
jgi:acetylornithine deacetylase